MAEVMQYETDVAIVGAGGAGVAAGIEALDAGARVIAFEKSAEPGGAAKISGGGCLIVGSPFQKKNGVQDNPDLAFKDWLEWGGPSADVAHQIGQPVRLAAKRLATKNQACEQAWLFIAE
jgi:predicted oxidoreductase